MAILYDILAVLIVVVFAIMGMKKGMLSIALRMFKWVLAVIMAFSFAGDAAVFMGDAFVESSQLQYSEKQLLYDDTNYGYSCSLDGTAVIANSSTRSISSGLFAAQIYARSFKNIIAIVVLYPVCFAAIFGLTLLACSLLAKLLEKANDVPIAGKINKALGIVLGAVYGFAVLCLLCGLVFVVAHFSNGSISWLNDDVIGNTFIVKFIINTIIL